MCISTCLVLYLVTGSVDILIALWFSQNRTMDKVLPISNSKRIPCIQAVWLQGILLEFDLGSNLSIVLFYDNKISINISIDPVTKQRTKHVEIHMHYFRELVHDRTIILQYCLNDEQIADIFTKIFLENNFTYLHSLLGMISSGWSNYFQCSAWGWVFPTRYSLFSSLSLFLNIVWVSVLYRVTYGLCFWGPRILMHFMLSTSPEYILREGVGDI